MRLSVLASGSSGSAIHLEEDGASLLLDAGLDPVDARERIATALGETPALPLAVLLSHEHRAHAAHAAAYGALGLPLRGSAGTVEALAGAGVPAAMIGVLREQETIGPFEISSVPVPHGAAEPIAFVIATRSGRIGVLTDCGYAAPAVAQPFSGVDLLLLEANHDPDLLRAGPYPPSLKRRLGGRLGHLSNGEAAAMLRLVGRPYPRMVLLVHLSRVNNRPRLARAAVERVCVGAQTQLLVAPAVGAGPTIGLSPAGGPRLLPRRRQLSLPLDGPLEGAPGDLP